MATDWGPILQTVIGAVAAAGGGFAAAWMQGHSQLQLERQRRRQGAADTLADLTKLLEDMDPTTRRYRTEIDGKQVLGPLVQRRDENRVELLRLAVGHPTRRVRRLSRRLDARLTVLIRSLAAYLDQRSMGHSATEYRGWAARDHRKAAWVLTRLLDTL